MHYTINFKNNYCAGSWATEGEVGGLLLDTNPYGFPQELFMSLISEIAPSVRLRIELSIIMTIETLAQYPELQDKLRHSYTTEIPQKFTGKDPRDQRPAVTCREAFLPVCEIISPFWCAGDFEEVQAGENPIVDCEITICDSTTEGQEAIDRLIKLLGYAPIPKSAPSAA